MLNEYYVNDWMAVPRYRTFTFWLNDGVPYNRLAMSIDGYEITNTHTIVSDREHGLLVAHTFEFTNPGNMRLVFAEDYEDACNKYDLMMKGAA